MGQQQSKDELLYQQVSYGNAQGIKTLRSQGAGLEWIDREGKTPLILACMSTELYNVAKTLIELGANVNAYRAGRQAGTPLHHAAKRGLENTVKLLLSHGANPLIINDDCLTPLEVARAKGFSNVVRAIENHICLFSGWMREFYGPGFLEVLAPQLLSRKVWVVILPTGSRNLQRPFKLEMAIYSNVQDSKPRTLIALWKANLEDPKLNQPDPSVVILANSTIPRGRRRRRRCNPQTIRQTRIKLAPANENDRQQLQQFCDACKGIPQAVRPLFLHDSQRPPDQATAPPDDDDLELAMAINASIQSAIEQTPNFHVQSSGEASSSGSRFELMDGHSHPHPGNQTTVPPKEYGEAKLNSDTSVPTTVETSDANPSAPPMAHGMVEDGPVHYPAIDSSPVVLSSPADDSFAASNTEDKKDDGGLSVCAVCLDAPSEAACVPCGHVAGCVSCLNEIKGKKWGCPVCRAKIEQVIKIYHV